MVRRVPRRWLRAGRYWGWAQWPPPTCCVEPSERPVWEITPCEAFGSPCRAESGPVFDGVGGRIVASAFSLVFYKPGRKFWVHLELSLFNYFFFYYYDLWGLGLPAKNAAIVIKAAFQLKMPVFEVSAAVLKNKSCSNACLTVIGTCFMGSMATYCNQLNGKY